MYNKRADVCPLAISASNLVNASSPYWALIKSVKLLSFNKAIYL